MPDIFEEWFQHFSQLGYGFAEACAMARKQVDQIQAKRNDNERLRDLIDGGYEVGSC